MSTLEEISRRFGKKAMELSVPEMSNGRQEIFVRFSNGDSIRVESDSPEEAWAALWAEATPAEDGEQIEQVEAAILAELRRQSPLQLAFVSDDTRGDCHLLDGEFDMSLVAAAAVRAMQSEDPGIPVYRLKDGGDT